MNFETFTIYRLHIGNKKNYKKEFFWLKKSSKKSILNFFMTEISLHLGVPDNQISLHFRVPDNQIALHFRVPDNQIALHFGVPDNQISLHLGVPDNQISLRFKVPDNCSGVLLRGEAKQEPDKRFHFPN